MTVWISLTILYFELILNNYKHTIKMPNVICIIGKLILKIKEHFRSTRVLEERVFAYIQIDDNG